MGAGSWGLDLEFRSQGEYCGWLREHSLKWASVPKLTERESKKKSGTAKDSRDLCFRVHEERIFRTPRKRASETGMSRSYQRGHQRRAWNAKAAAAATKKPVCKHRSLSTPPFLGACAACHCLGPVIQRQLPQEDSRCTSGCCNVMPASATAGSPHIPYSSLPLTWVSQSPLISHSLNPILSRWRTDSRRWPICRGGARSKAEPQELSEKRREREISPGSLRSGGLNLHNQLDVACISGPPEETMNHPQIEAVDFGSNWRIGVCCLRQTSFWYLCFS